VSHTVQRSSDRARCPWDGYWFGCDGLLVVGEGEAVVGGETVLVVASAGTVVVLAGAVAGGGS